MELSWMRLFVLITILLPCVQAKCRPGWLQYNPTQLRYANITKCYKRLGKYERYWTLARDKCDKEKVLMPEPTTEEELEFLLSNNLIIWYTWLGARRHLLPAGSEHGFVWTQRTYGLFDQPMRETLPWSRWINNGPEKNTRKNCVILAPQGKLFNVYCGSPGYTAAVLCSYDMYNNCYDRADKGKWSYIGTQTTTKDGKTCQKWSSQTPHKHGMAKHWPGRRNPDHNLCRNPDGEDSPWCYTIDPATRWQYCGVTECSDIVHKNCYTMTWNIWTRDRGKWSYGGTKNTTKDGKTCQKWSSQTPHHHSEAKHWPDKVSPDHNFCRNPDAGRNPWCFTTDPATRRQSCGVPKCSDVIEGTFVVRDSKLNFAEASDFCLRHGMKLATPKTAEEQTELKEAVNETSAEIFWIGLKRASSDWQWVDHTSLGKYRPWACGQPNNWNGEQNCVDLRLPSSELDGWNDANCNDKRAFICQKSDDDSSEASEASEGTMCRFSVLLTVFSMLVSIANLH